MIEPSSPTAPSRPATPDHLVRLHAGELAAIVFQHLHTVQDELVLMDCPGARRGGLTEWQGVHAGRLVSVGWDWVELSDGLLRLAVVAPRSNLRLVDAAGYDLHPDDEAVTLGRHIDLLHWQDDALRGLAEPFGFGVPSPGPGSRLH